MKLTPSPVLIPVRILLGGRGLAGAPLDAREGGGARGDDDGRLVKARKGGGRSLLEHFRDPR